MSPLAWFAIGFASCVAVEALLVVAGLLVLRSAIAQASRRLVQAAQAIGPRSSSLTQEQVDRLSRYVRATPTWPTRAS